MRVSKFVLLLLALTLSLPLGPSSAFGQGQTTGSIRGQVRSSEGGPLPGVQVIATNVETGLARGTLTDNNGRYAILLLPPARYVVRVQSIGYAPAVVEGVRVVVNEATPVDVVITPQAVAIEGITTSIARTRVDARQGGVIETVTPAQVENLPVQGRDFTDLIKLSPLVSPQPGVGTGGQFSIAGARTSGTNVQVDGVDANNQFFGENRGSSRTPFAFSLESIRELQLITNGFDVEYGNYVGGVVNAITRGGTNEFKGGAFLFYRDEWLTANDFEGRAPTDFNVYQFGANVSGPIIRDKMHFFLSADAQVKEQPIFAGIPDPTPQGLTQQNIDDLILALERQGVLDSRGFFGQFDQNEDNLVLFGRIDWQLGDNNRLTVRQNYSDFEQTNDRIRTNETLTHGGPFRNETWSTVVELNSVLGGNAYNTLRFQYSDEDRPRVPNEPGGFLPEIRVDFGSNNIRFGGDGIIFRNRLQEEKFQIIDNLTYQLGAHQLKIGTNNQYANTANTFWLLGNGSFRFLSLADFINNNPDTYSRFTRACPVPLEQNAAGEAVICPDPDVPFAEFSSLEWSVYGQDDWQVSDRLLLTFGLRYGGTTFFDEPGELPQVTQAFGIPTGVVPDFRGLSPRFSFTYDIGGNEENLVRGGVGLLVGRTPTVLAGNVFQTERPLLSVFCSRADRNVPSLNLPELLADPTGLKNPSACVGGEAPGGRPEHTIFSTDFELPRTLKANLGYEQVLPGLETRVGLDFIFSQTWNNFIINDLNLKPVQFRLAEGDRAVFVPPDLFNPRRSAGADRLQDPRFDRIFFNVSEGEARSYNLTLEVSQPVRDDLVFGANYAFVHAFDNGSFSCCTSQEGFSTPTAGNPNTIGDIGDEIDGAWGPSDFERRHTFVLNFVYQGPWGIQASGIWRSQSGTPWTPTVNGDINADALNFNDRAFVGTDLRFATPEDRATLERLIEENECLADQIGQIATRNSCRNPWFHSFDLRLAKWVPTVGGQRAELILDLFNVLNGLNDEWGRFMGVFGSRTELLSATGFDQATNEVIYRVNPSFGEARPVGFDPFQFQAQLGFRYRF